MLFIDTMVLDSPPRRTKDGYLVAMPKVARTGIQEYRGFELERPNVDVIKVYRPEEEVFSTDALHSFGHRPITEDHPPELVDAKNWKKYARGMTGGDVLRNGEFINVPMALMDDDLIKKVMDREKVELSMGYTADIDFTPGVTPTGEKYDAVQKNIRGNHLAIVDAARGGKQLRVIDYKQTQEENDMNLQKILIDGISVEVTDMAAEVYRKYTRDMEEKMKKDQERIKELEDELSELKKKMDATKKDTETKDAEIVTLKKQVEDAALTPAKMDAAVKVRAELIDSAKKLLPSVIVDGKTDADIRKQVVSAKLGDAAKDWKEEQILTSFNTLAVSLGAQDSFRNVVMHQQNNGTNVSAHDAYKQRLGDAWKPKQQAN